MDEHLIAIAGLKLSRATDKLTGEMNRQLQELNGQLAAKGVLMSGGAETARFDIRANVAEKLCRTVADTWKDLLTRQNRGLTRDDVTFIMQQVEGYTTTYAKSLSDVTIHGTSSVVPGNYWKEQASNRMRELAGDIRRDLEIQFREQEAFPSAKEALLSSPIVIQNANISNLNVGTQVGTINTALQVLSSEGSDHQELAGALKNLTEAVLADRQLKDDQKQEAVDALTAMADDAKSGKASVSTKSLIAYFPSIIGLSADLLTLWNAVGPMLRTHFHL